VEGILRARRRSAPHRRSVDEEAVTGEVYDDLSALEAETIWDNSGRQRHGYVDPTEASWELMEETMDPHLRRLERLWDEGYPDDATRYCGGMLAGLCQFKMEGPGKIVEWMVDDPYTFAERVLEKWQGICLGGRRLREVAEFAVAKLSPEFLEYVHDEAIKEAQARAKAEIRTAPLHAEPAGKR